MRGFFFGVAAVLAFAGLFAPVLWLAALVTVVLAIGVAPSGRRADGRRRTGGLLGGVWDDFVVSQKMKRCPTCDELIRRAARKCRHCGDTLPSEDASDPSS